MACTSRAGLPKKRWPNSTAAKFVADLAAAKDGKDRTHYKCEDCQGWHVATVRDQDKLSA